MPFTPPGWERHWRPCDVTHNYTPTFSWCISMLIDLFCKYLRYTEPISAPSAYTCTQVLVQVRTYMRLNKAGIWCNQEIRPLHPFCPTWYATFAYASELICLIHTRESRTICMRALTSWLTLTHTVKLSLLNITVSEQLLSTTPFLSTESYILQLIQHGCRIK